MNMNAKFHAIELMVNEVKPSIDFYQQVLAFDLIEAERDQNDEIYWALMGKDGFLISFKQAKRLQDEVAFFKNRPIGGSICMVFQVENLTEIYQQVENACEIINHPHLTPCGTHEFSLLDNNGYIMTFETQPLDVH